MLDDGENRDRRDDEPGSTELESAGETIDSNLLNYASMLAMRAARSEPGEYGKFTNSHMAFEVENGYETEDLYVVTLLFRPQNKFVGAPGREHFFIKKTGELAGRQVTDPPEPGRQSRPPDNLQESVATDNSPINVPWSATDMVIGTVVVVGSVLGFLILLRLLDSVVGDAMSNLQLIWLSAASEGVLVYVVWRFSVKKYGVGWKTLGLRRPSTRRNTLLIVATLIGSVILTGAYAALVTQLDIKILIPGPVPEGLRQGGTFQRLMTIIAIAGLVPFVEEVFFRGFLFQGFATRYGVIWGAVMSSAVFAIVHFAVGTLIPIFLIGLLFAALYAKTRSTWMPISAHAIQNLLALTLSA